MLPEYECGLLKETTDANQTMLDVHPVFAGIQLFHVNAYTDQLMQPDVEAVPDSVYEIVHCQEGRMEYCVNGEFCDLSPGDLAIVQKKYANAGVRFPMQHFHGIAIRIDLENTPDCFSCLLEDVSVRPRALTERLCGKKTGFIARSSPAFEHIFSELHRVPQEVQRGYFKIKVLELFLFLSILDAERDEFQKRTYSVSQANLARRIEQYLTEHMDARITLKQLAETFDVSETHIKNTFKGIYGVSFYTFVRRQKMESAANMLANTDKSILKIAEEHGYSNGSKFSSAFREVKGVTPNEYRSQSVETDLFLS